MSKLNWGRLLLTGASFAAMGVGVAHAQEATDEIVVTATGRSAAIQDVPLAVTAVTAETIQNAGVSDLRDLQQLAPGYRFYTGQSNTAGANAIIRGIGTGADNPGFESAVGIFIDGVYRSRASTALNDLPDVDRIEVLRGPQGTLFGRNTSAGALNIITAAPEFETHAWMEGSTGNLGLLSGKVGVNAPLGDKLAVRFDGSLHSRDGYITDMRSGQDVNTRDRWSARGQALWDISDAATLRIIVDGGQTDEICCSAVTLRRGLAGVAINQLLAADPNGVGVLPGNTPSAASFAIPGIGDVSARQTSITPGHIPHETTNDWGVSGQLDWDLGGVDLTSITAYRDWGSTRDQDIDFSDLDRAYRDGLEIGFKTFTQEVRLHGEAGRLDWLVGGFVGHETMEQTDRIRFGTQAPMYVDALARGVDLSPLGFAGAHEVFRSINPGAPLLFNDAMLALAGTSSSLSNAGALAGGAGPLSTALSTTDPANGSGQQADNWKTTTNSYALFTHDEFKLTDAFRLTVGVRYNRDDKDLSANLLSVVPACGVIQTNAASAVAIAQYTPNPLLSTAQQTSLVSLQHALLSFLTLACNPAVNTIANGNYSDSHVDEEWTGTASLSWNVNDDLMLYTGYSRGYKSGGWNVDRSGFNITPFSVAQPSTSSLEFKPEFVDAFEAGFKSTIFGHTYFNVNAFYERVTDFQENSFSGFNFITYNAPELISRGAEVDLTSHITDHLSFQGGLMYDDAYHSKAVQVGALVNGQVIPEGTTLAYASKWVATGALTYHMPLTSELSALFYVNARYNSEYPVQTLGRNPLTDNPGYTLINARIGIGANNDRWSLEFWGRNLSDETYNIGAFIVPEQSSLATGDSGNLDVYPSEPRTWGVTLRARY